MKVWKLKSCPRCGGDIFLDMDEEHRWYEMCLQCSYLNELKKIDNLAEHSTETKKKPALAGKLQPHKHP